MRALPADQKRRPAPLERLNYDLRLALYAVPASPWLVDGACVAGG